MDLASKFLFKGGQVDITPTESMPLAGYASRKGAFARVSDRLEANVAVISDGTHRSVMVSTDLLYVGKYLQSAIKERLGDLVDGKELFITASHTHFAPATDSSKPKLGAVKPEYIQFAAGKIADLIRQTTSDKMEDASIRHTVVPSADIIANRMNHGLVSLIPPRMGIKPKVGGFMDKNIHILRIADMDGRPKAIIWSFACHPVGFYDLNAVSSDYPGTLREAVRREAGAQIPVLFMQGFSGDIRPIMEPRSNGLLGPTFKRFDKSIYERWTGALVRTVIEATKSDQGKILESSVRISARELPLSDIGLRGSNEPVEFKSVDVGKVKIVGISAEPVAEYVPKLNNLFPGSTVMPVGCLGHVFGYLPTSEMLHEKEYEITGFQGFFSLSGKFAPDVGEKVEKTLASL